MNNKRISGGAQGAGKILLFVFSLLLLITCEKPERILQFETLEVSSSDITCSSVKLQGVVTDLGSKPIEQHGLLLSESSVPNLGQQNTVEKPLGALNVKKVFSADFTGLKANTTYYFRVYVVVDGMPELGSIKNFTTKDSETPAVTAGTIREISMTSALLEGEVTSDGGEAATVRGICWGASANPTIINALDTTINGTGTGTFEGRMTGLTAGTQYYARAYARNSKGTTYNDADIVFKTHTFPVVTTTGISNITATGATSGGEVTDDGGADVYSRGICWSTSPGPTIALATITSDGTGEGAFTSTMSGLSSETTYYVRAYARNKYGTSYGAELSFIASATIQPPSATTNSATPVGIFTATLNGSVNANDLSATVTFEYGLTTSYGQAVTAVQSPVSGSLTTPVSADLSGLLASTTYHFRLKAVSAGGISYGDDVTFTTAAALPDVSDYDNNAYNIITIGTQQWLQTNLRTEHFNNGDTVAEVTVNSKWTSSVSAAMCYFNNDEAAYKSEYGGLYNWYAVNDIRNICPVGWHVPTDDDWTNLSVYLGGESVAGGKLKETGIIHWSGPNTGASNELGFTGLPGGYRSFSGEFADISLYGYWWTSTSLSVTDAWSRYLEYSSGVVSRYNYSVRDGFSVRCIKGGLPLALTIDAGGISSNSATLNAKVNPNNASATITFEYGTTTSYGQTIPAAQSPANGYVPVNVSAEITGLTESTTYYFRVKAVNAGGTVYGGSMAFNTAAAPAAPSAATAAASSVLSTSAVLKGTVNANNSSTVVTFEYGTTTSYGTEVTAGESPVTGTTDTAVSAGISGLSASTTYHYRVKAVNAGGTTYGNDATFMTAAALPTVSDYDGNTYNIISVSTQEWMQKNLMVTHYSNGDAIPNVTDNAAWGGLTTGAYAWYNNDAAGNKNTYGALYNWYAVSDIRNVCPTGWHVPGDDEWNYLGGLADAGGKMKEEGLAHWVSPNTGATNETGFTALPAGEREADGNNFSAIGYSNFLWSSTPWDASYSWARAIFNNSSNLLRQYYNNKYGYSVRCIKGAIPLAATGSATDSDHYSSTLNGSVNPNGLSTDVSFEYGLTTAYGTTVPATPGTVAAAGVTAASAAIAGLDAQTTYHYRIKTVNSSGTTYGADRTFTTSPEPVSDADGNEYRTVIIGSQLWMQENLRTTLFSNGDTIPNVTGNTEWSGLSTGAYAWYNNNISNKNPYGALYNFHAVSDVRNICPAGWHVPTYDEMYLLNPLGSCGLKEAGTSHWLMDDPCATNSSGFTALPSGLRLEDGGFSNLGTAFQMWSSTNNEGVNMWYAGISGTLGLGYATTGPKYGMSVRCLKGELPLAETEASTAAASTSAVLHGKVNPNGASATVSFEYGTTTFYGSTAAATQSPLSGAAPVDVSAGLTGLTPGTTYHYRVKAVNTGGTSYGSDMTFTTTLGTLTVSDYDGNTYDIITIGTQHWLKQNLKTTKYNDGISIPLVTDNAEWEALTTPGFCWYDNDAATYKDTYGALYNWYTINTGKLCPAGWHVPTDAEWTTMENYLIASGYNYDGTTTGNFIAKALASTILWTLSDNTGAVGNTDYPAKRNATGFTALPGGYRDYNGYCDNISYIGRWGSSTENSATSVWSRGLSYSISDVSRGYNVKKIGFSVRCLKD